MHLIRTTNKSAARSASDGVAFLALKNVRITDWRQSSSVANGWQLMASVLDIHGSSGHVTSRPAQIRDPARGANKKPCACCSSLCTRLYFVLFLVHAAGPRSTLNGTTGNQPNTSWCNQSLVVTEPRGFLASVTAEENGAGSPACPWTIQAKSGQTITLSVYDFSKQTH
jgi:hypothetical protein